VVGVYIKSTLRNWVGGCAGRDCKGGKVVKLFDGEWKAFSPKGTEESMDCLFNCLKVKGSTIRKALNIERKTPISISQIPNIADHTNINIKIYNATKSVLIDYDKGY